MTVSAAKTSPCLLDPQGKLILPRPDQLAPLQGEGQP